MLSVSEAFAALLREVTPAEPVRTALAESLGLVLAADVFSDLDSPPFDKALMDGFAVRSADVSSSDNQPLRVIEEVTAGMVAAKPVGRGEATRIMTGTPVPAGADMVVPWELVDYNAADGSIHLRPGPISSQANILPRGTAKRAGDLVLPAGRLLRPQELGALAEMGQQQVSVRPVPRIAVLATGDELVSIAATPGPGQIRNSNETMLCAQVRRAGAVPMPLGIARDERTHLKARIAAGLECDMLILSGGVSAGKLDLVPSELAAAGVRQVFHQVNLKPGKPIWFGVLDAPAADRSSGTSRRLVFGLPGNPVSSLVCFELFVRTAIRRRMGIEPAEPQPISARLTKVHVARGERPTYNPARLEWTETGPVVTPVPWHGSSDLQATVDANAMAFIPPGDRTWQAGNMIEVYSWD